MSIVPTKGEKAPDFSLNNQNGEKISLKSFRGKRVILYFYPEDDTPLCTEEACVLRDAYSNLTAKGVVVLGVSPDGADSHRHFIQKFNLPFHLLSDPDHSMMETYGAWAEKVMFGNRFMGVKRYTFLINEEGRIDHVILKVISKKQMEQIRKIWKDL